MEAGIKMMLSKLSSANPSFSMANPERKKRSSKLDGEAEKIYEFIKKKGEMQSSDIGNIFNFRGSSCQKIINILKSKSDINHQKEKGIKKKFVFVGTRVSEKIKHEERGEGVVIDKEETGLPKKFSYMG